MSKPIDYSNWEYWFNSTHADISSDPSIPRYQWPWNDDDRDWIPDVLDSGIVWTTHKETIEDVTGDLILEEALFNNILPQGWTEVGEGSTAWQQVGLNYSESKKEDD